AEPGGYSVSADLVQEGEVYRLRVPIVVEMEGGKERQSLEVSQAVTPISIEVKKMPLSLAVDPDAQVFRRLYPEEIVPGLNALLEDPEKVFVLPEGGDEGSRRIYGELADRARERKGGRIVSVGELNEEELQNSSLMLLGDSWKSSIFSRLFSKLPGSVLLRDGVFAVDGKRVDQDDQSFLLTYPHPLRDGKWVTIYFGRSPETLSRASYIFFYGWDSYLLFENGRPAHRGNFPPGKSFTSYRFSLQEDVSRIEPRKLRGHVAYLASEELRGRLPGTPGYRKAQGYITKNLEEMGIAPILQPFSMNIRDIEEVTLSIEPSQRGVTLKAIPFRFSREGEWKGPIRFVDKVEAVSDLSGRSAIAYLEPSDNPSAEMVSRKIGELQSRNPAALLLFIRENGLDTLSPYITYPSYFPPGLEKSLKEKKEKGYGINPLIEVSKVMARGEEPPIAGDTPVFVIPYSRREEDAIRSFFDQKDAFVEFSLRFKERRLSDANIGAIISGRDPVKKGEFLVLGAHYDHLGIDEKSGARYPGADDNASGVAALLEIARTLMQRRDDLQRSVLLLFFGGEE
ncbi:MAG: M28 family peptidase, partial [Deltaproteobacteria bacterium]